MRDQTLKTWSGLLLAGVMAVSLAACGQQNDTADTSAQAETAQTTDAENQQPDSTTTPDTTSSGSGKTLVVYYSASGNTKGVAEKIAEAAGADLFEITPVEPYTSDDLNWTNDNSRVSREHEDESLRDAPLTTTTVENWEEYDTVFLGYPIWWGIAAWPVDNFVKDNDFTGKTVIPFATSASSGMGQSGDLLEELAGTGTWQDGQRFSGGADQSEVTSWVESLGLTN